MRKRTYVHIAPKLSRLVTQWPHPLDSHTSWTAALSMRFVGDLLSGRFAEQFTDTLSRQPIVSRTFQRTQHPPIRGMKYVHSVELVGHQGVCGTLVRNTKSITIFILYMPIPLKKKLNVSPYKYYFLTGFSRAITFPSPSFTAQNESCCCSSPIFFTANLKVQQIQIYFFPEQKSSG